MFQQRRNTVGLLLVALTCLVVFVAFSQQEDIPAVGTDVYQPAMSAQVTDVYDLEQYFVDQQYTFLPILPPDPDFTLVQSGGEVLPFNWKTFPTEFEDLIAEYENSVPVYPVTIIEDPISRDVVFFNADGKEIYSIPPTKDYNPFAYVESAYPGVFLSSFDSKTAEELRSFYDPARIQIQARLIPQEYVEPYLYVQDRIAAEAAALAASSGGGMTLMRSGYSDSNINFEVIARTNNGARMTIGYPNDFTNRLDVFTCNDLMQYVWVFATKSLSTTGTNEITWVDTNYWVSLGPSVRFYAAGNADLDTDHDGYSDASEIMVYRTSETDSNSRPIRISGTVSYSGIETGTIRVLSTIVSDSWSIAQSVALSGPGVYSNDIGNNQSYWFKAFQDVNSSYARETWEPWGVYSVNSTLITSDTSGLNITMQDQPSLWGAVNYSGSATGNVWVVAVTASDSWNTTYSSMLSWDQGGDPLTGGVQFLTFPASFSIAGIPVSNYWIRAFIDTNYDGSYTEGEIAGQYTSNAIPVSNRVTALNFTLDQDSDADGLPDWWEWQHGTDANNPDSDGDGFTDGDEVNTYGTDPLNKYSVPPLPMLSTSGKYILDAASNRVVLKSVNIGGWLQWEQWMLQYEPALWTNEWGKLYGTATNAADQLEEQTARELIIDNTDLGISLLAISNNGSSGVSIQTNWVNWLTEPNLKFVGGLGNGDWLRFTNVNFGTGVSNLSVSLAVDDTYAGQQIEVHLDATNGTLIGVVTAKSTGPSRSDWAYWCALTEQTIPLTNVTGTHTVYFVGKSTAGDVANVYRFRFWRDPNTKNLFETFRDKYFTTNDLDTIRSLGYNCIRLAFFHNLLEDEAYPYAYKTSGWSRLDWALSECAKRRLWVILDLHSTPGGQNPYHASGLREPFRNRMWSSEYNKDRTEKLWAAIASRYATNPVVAGYDIFNEPDPSRTNSAKTAYQWAFSNSILPMVSRVHQAIRSNDTAHILFLEGNMMYTNMWDDAYWWPVPASNGWTNVVYEFHVYDQTVYGKDGVDDWWFSTQKGICDSMIRCFTRFSEAQQTPVYVGEFAPWDERNTEYWLRQCEANDLHWGHWNYRSWGWDDPTTPTKGRTVWGLDYRSAATTNQKPRLSLDALGTLSNKFAQYDSTNYAANSQLQKVVQNNATRTNAASERCEYYLNTFNAPNAEGSSSGWPWKKVTAVGYQANCWLRDQKARLYVGSGPIVLRCRSREETDGRFEINDGSGCRFSIDVAAAYVTNEVSGGEAEVRLGCVRDEITTVVSNFDTRGIIARLVYDKAGGATNIALSLFAKTGGTNTYGVALFTNSPIAFVPGATLELLVTKTNAVLSYNGSVQGSEAHTNLALDTWMNGAVAFVEAAQAQNGTVQYLELDNLKAARDVAATDNSFQDSFTGYVSGNTLLAEPEHLTTQEYWAPSRKTESYATNGAAFWIAREWAYGGTWMSPRRDYQDDVRLPASPTNVVEARAAYSNFTQGIAKICLMPELFTGEIYGDFAGDALYAEFERQGANVKFTAYRHYAVGGGRALLQTNGAAYVEGRAVSLQASTNTVRLYYGTNLLIDASHGMTNYLAVYTNAAFPHYEFQNWGSTTNAAVVLDDVICRQLGGFTAPE